MELIAAILIAIVLLYFFHSVIQVLVIIALAVFIVWLVNHNRTPRL